MAYFDARGVRVPVAVECLQVVPGRVAEHIGVAPGDRLLRYDDKAVQSAQQLIAMAAHAAPGIHKLLVRRGRRRRSLRLRQESWGSAFAMRSPSSLSRRFASFSLRQCPSQRPRGDSQPRASQVIQGIVGEFWPDRKAVRSATRESGRKDLRARFKLRVGYCGRWALKALQAYTGAPLCRLRSSVSSKMQLDLAANGCRPRRTSIPLPTSRSWPAGACLHQLR